MPSRRLQKRLRNGNRPFAKLVFASALALFATSAGADEIRVLSGGGAQAPLRASLPEFEKTTGHRVAPTFAHVSVVQQKLAAGEQADLILLPLPLIAAVEKTLPLRPEGRRSLARVGIAVIVTKGATLPDVSSADAVRKMLIEAKSIEIPPPNGPAGAHLARMIEQLGIADTVRPKLVVKTAIDGGAQLVADGKVELAMQLLSEVQSQPGITVAGMLPSALQTYVVYGTAIPASNANPEPAISLAKFLGDPDKKEFWKAAGFELLDGDSAK